MDAPGIGEHVFQQVRRRLRAPDRTIEPFSGETRQKPGVVDMGVGQHHGIDMTRIERERLGIEPLQRARALKHAAVDKNARLAGNELVAGTGYRARSTVECERERLVHVGCMVPAVGSSKDLNQICICPGKTEPRAKKEYREGDRSPLPDIVHYLCYRP